MADFGVSETELFAMTEMVYPVARIVQIFKPIESRDNSEWKERLSVHRSG
jgi:hypothetical protein